MAQNNFATIRKLVVIITLALTGYAIWCGAYFTALVILGLTLLGLMLLRRKSASPEDDNQAIAEWGVPHTTFNRTGDSFTVAFNRLPEWLHKMMAMGSAKGTGAFIALPVLLMGLVFMIACGIFGGTKLEVTKDFYIIDRKKFARKDAGAFSVHHTFKLPNEEYPLGVLGFRFGRRSVCFGGAWPEPLALDVASALNAHTHLVPQDGAQVSPAQLRAVRASEF